MVSDNGRTALLLNATASTILLLYIILMAAGCRHIVRTEIHPSVPPPDRYSRPRGNTPLGTEWWKSFRDPLLDQTITRSFEKNFTLKQTYARIMQAKLAAGQAASELYPEVTGGISAGSTWFSDGRDQKRYGADISISWEADLWKKLSSAEKASGYEAESTAEDHQAAALMLSAEITENYLKLVEQNLQLKLLDKQLAASNTFLELIELRFANGDASVVDIYQQRQQLSSIRSQLPKVKKEAMLFRNRLAVLTGEVPRRNSLEISETLPEFPPEPAAGIPADLLLNRPDLRSIHNKLLAADHRIAQAVADRLPAFRVTGSGGFSGSEISSDNFLISLLGELVTPVIDWRKRKMEVSKRQYLLNEILARYDHAFLVAIEETENGIWLEKFQIELMNSLADQLQIAEATLTESRNRYMQGLTDYLPVLTALQSLQQLERELLSQKSQLLVSRVHLYRALGGADILARPAKENPS